MDIKVHIADDHAMFRSGLKAFIESEGDITVVGESGNTFETLKWIAHNGPRKVDILILDINMPGPPATTLVKEIEQKYPQISILVLTMHREKRYLKEFFKLGVKGFMVKTSTGHELVQALRRISQGCQYVDPEMSKHLISNYLGQPSTSKTHLDALTKREREVCECLALGQTNTEVAQTLSISRRTVETHRAAIMAKLKLKSRAELVQFAMDNHLLRH